MTGDAPVPVAVATSQFEAELIVGLLQSNGLDGAVSADDAGGQEPQLQLQGVRVLVSAADADAARQVLADAQAEQLEPSESSSTSADEQFHVDVVSPTYWRVTFDNGPVNLLDPDTVEQLGALIERIEKDPDLAVVVFRSEKPGYFMAHWDFLSDTARVLGMSPGPTGLHPYLDNFVRLSKLPVATVAEIRGRARGAGSEFVLATDIRFASEKAVLGQFEVGVGAVPGGGPMARLGRLVGRGRALEILLGGDDIPAALAAAYGYVNRVVPDADIEGYVDAFARRIATFDKVAIAGIKELVDVATQPEDAELARGLQVYFATAGRPENRPFTERLFREGLQQPDGIETDLGTAIGMLRRER
jgi:enoyl-CoA hydratase/carnithine racemase